MNSNLKKIVKQVAKDKDIPEEVVSKAYISFWKFIRATIMELPLKDIKTEEELNELRTSFNVPAIGKLHVPVKRFMGLIAQYNYKKEHIFNRKKNEDKED